MTGPPKQNPKPAVPRDYACTKCERVITVSYRSQLPEPHYFILHGNRVDCAGKWVAQPLPKAKP